MIKWMNESFAAVVLHLNKFLTIDFNKQILHKKWSFLLRISSLNVTISAVSYGFGHICWRHPQWKTSFLVQWKIRSTCARKMLCLDYSNLQEKRNLRRNYTWLLEGIYFLFIVLEMNVLNDIFYKRKMF